MLWGQDELVHEGSFSGDVLVPERNCEICPDRFRVFLVRSVSFSDLWASPGSGEVQRMWITRSPLQIRKRKLWENESEGETSRPFAHRPKCPGRPMGSGRFRVRERRLASLGLVGPKPSAEKGVCVYIYIHIISLSLSL